MNFSFIKYFFLLVVAIMLFGNVAVRAEHDATEAEEFAAAASSSDAPATDAELDAAASSTAAAEE